MSLNWEKCIEKPLILRRKEVNLKFNHFDSVYGKNIEAEAKKTSQLFRDKIENERKRLGLS